MSGPIDESFTDQNLENGTVLEFGVSPGVQTARRAQRPELQITGVDLYEPVTVEGFKFIQGDFMDIDFSDPFDNVTCVSSFEHCGIETLNYLEGHRPDFNYHLVVAEKLKSLVRPNGKLIITCPFGDNETYLVDNLGHTFLSSADSGYTPRWGYRVFSLGKLQEIFSPLVCVKAAAFECKEGDYFDINNWVPIDVEKDHPRFHGRDSNRAVMGAVFTNENYHE